MKASSSTPTFEPITPDGLFVRGCPAELVPEFLPLFDEQLKDLLRKSRSLHELHVRYRDSTPSAAILKSCHERESSEPLPLSHFEGVRSARIQKANADAAEVWSTTVGVLESVSQAVETLLRALALDEKAASIELAKSRGLPLPGPAGTDFAKALNAQADRIKATRADWVGMARGGVMEMTVGHTLEVLCFLSWDQLMTPLPQKQRTLLGRVAAAMF